MTERTIIQIRKPVLDDHKIVPGVVKRLKTNFEINTDLLLGLSLGNKKFVEETQQLIEHYQSEDESSNGFLSVGVFHTSKVNETTEEKSEWLHVVFNHGYGITLIAGRVGQHNIIHKEFIDKSFLYSMATMLQNE